MFACIQTSLLHHNFRAYVLRVWYAWKQKLLQVLSSKSQPIPIDSSKPWRKLVISETLAAMSSGDLFKDLLGHSWGIRSQVPLTISFALISKILRWIPCGVSLRSSTAISSSDAYAVSDWILFGVRLWITGCLLEFFLDFSRSFSQDSS